MVAFEWYVDFSPFLINLADIAFLLLRTYSKLAMLDALILINSYADDLKRQRYLKQQFKNHPYSIFFRINDRVISANNISLEGVDYICNSYEIPGTEISI